MDNKEYRSDLVFDLGFHRGEDTGYYLAMGRQVVAVEANADLIDGGNKIQNLLIRPFAHLAKDVQYCQTSLTIDQRR